MNDKVELAHGDGGKQTENLISEVFVKHFGNELLLKSRDAAVFQPPKGRLAYTTDSFVVAPLFFPGGNIGKLSICGTINDLACAGALPLYLSAGFVLEEGFSISELHDIAHSMGEISRSTGTSIVAADTKVVERGRADGVYINTSGLGYVLEEYRERPLEAGDVLLITGTLAEHGTCILAFRHGLEPQQDLYSDCKPLCSTVKNIGGLLGYVKRMADPTRGGLATVLSEFAQSEKADILIYEEALPFRPPVRAVHALLGTDPLYFASEGRLLLFIEKEYSTHILKALRETEPDACIIGEVCKMGHGTVRLQTRYGGQRLLLPLMNQLIPRIC